MMPLSSLILRAMSCALLLGALTPATRARAQAIDVGAILSDPVFTNNYKTQYGYLTDTSLAVLTEELRGVLEDVATAGSRVGSTPTGHRVQSFERLLWRRLQDSLCAGAAAGGRAEPIQSVVVRGTAAAGNESGLTLAMPYTGRISAIAVRIVEKSDRARLCRSTSLNELSR